MAFACIVFLPAPYISALKTGNATECSSRFQSGGEKRGGNIRTKQPLIKQPVISSTASGEFTKLFFFFFNLETVAAGPPWSYVRMRQPNLGTQLTACFTHCLTYVNPVCLGDGGN